MNNSELDREIDLKTPHIKNIKKVISSTDSEEPEIFLALLLYRIVKNGVSIPCPLEYCATWILD